MGDIMENTIESLEEKYDLELEKVVKQIVDSKAKLVLLQFPDGLKPYATAVVDLLREKTKAEFLIWMGSCFGACDTPVLGKDLEKQIDLVIQFGHNKLQPSY
jgi:2-(3-amino-3-carboxypropyl)histidine synthase